METPVHITVIAGMICYSAINNPTSTCACN
jgi:hypothetical protein